MRQTIRKKMRGGMGPHVGAWARKMDKYLGRVRNFAKDYKLISRGAKAASMFAPRKYSGTLRNIGTAATMFGYGRKRKGKFISYRRRKSKGGALNPVGW